MIAIHDALKARRDELAGQPASEDEVERLVNRLNTPALDTLLSIYRELPVSNSTLQFTVDAKGVAYQPDSSFMEDYDPDREHELLWMSPAQILFDITESFAGPAAFAAGFVPIGNPTSGGDPYFLRYPAQAGDTGLYEVYYDWIDPNDDTPVPPEGSRMVASSMAQVISVARFV